MGSSRFIRGLTWLVVAAIMLSVASPALAAHRFATGESSLPPGVTRQSEQAADQSISSAAHREEDSPTNVPPATASHALTATTQPTSTLALTTTGIVTPASPLAIGGAPDAMSNVTPPTLTMTADPMQATPGEVITYTVAFSNVAAVPLAGVVLSDTLPGGLVFVENSATGFTYFAQQNRLAWQIERIEPGQGLAGGFRARVTGLAVGELITNTVSATSAATPLAAASAIVEVAPPRQNRVWATPTEGGWLRSEDRRVDLRAPRGAVGVRTELRYGAAGSPALPPHILFAFALDAVDEQGQAVHEFAAPLTLSVFFDPRRLPPGALARLSLFYFDEAMGAWQAIPSRVDARWRRVTAQTEHFSVFGLGIDAIDDPPSFVVDRMTAVRGAQTSLYGRSITYRYAFEVPAGRGGLAPALGLSYSSSNHSQHQGHYSYVGHGWELAGADAVQRNPESGEVTMTLGGQTYTLISYDNGWFVKENPLIKVTYSKVDDPSFGSPNQALWTVRTPDGMQYTYFGKVSKAGSNLVYDSPMTFYWGCAPQGAGGEWRHLEWERIPLTQVQDVNGNQIIYAWDYEENVGAGAMPSNCWPAASEMQRHIRAIRLSRVSYNAGRTLVDMAYGARADRPTGYLDGNRWHFFTDMKLTSAQVKVLFNGQSTPTTLRTYVLSHLDQGSPPNPSQILLNLMYVEEQAGSRALRTTFDYSGYTAPFTCTYRYLTRVQNAFGGAVQFTATGGNSANWETDCQSGNEVYWRPPTVTQRTEQDTATGATATWTYDGSGWNDDAHGFAKVWVIVPNAEACEIHEYEQMTQINGQARDHLAGREKKTTVCTACASGGVCVANGELAHTETVWSHDSANLPLPDYSTLAPEDQPRFVWASEQKAYESRFNDDGTLAAAGVAVKYTTFEYQVSRQVGSVSGAKQFGNLTQVKEYQGTNAGFEATPLRTQGLWYYPHEGNWVVDKPAVTKLYSGDQATLFAENRSYYDDSASYTAAPPKGLLTKQETMSVLNGVYQSNPASVTRTFSYAANGNPLWARDELGNQTTFSYDSWYQAYQVCQQNAVGHQTKTTYYGAPGDGVCNTTNGSTTSVYNRFGQVEKAWDANSALSEYRYDDLGWLTSMAQAPDVIGAPTTEYTYRPLAEIALNQPFWLHEKKRDGSTGDSYWHGWTFLDGWGRSVQTKQEADNDALGAAQHIETTTDYTWRDAVWHAGAPVFVSGGVTGATAPSYRSPGTWSALPKTTSTYDGRGRLLQQVLPGNATVRTRYNVGFTASNQTRLWQATIDANNRQRISESDPLGRLRLARQFSGSYAGGPGWSDTAYATSQYAYDIADRLVDVWDADSNNTHIVYDGLGRKGSMTDPDMGAWSYGYDLAGNLTRQTDAKNQRLCFYYDGLNRLKGKTYSTGATACPADPGYTGYAVKYYYDTDDTGAPVANGLGRRTVMMDSSSSAAWTYDSRGRVTNDTRTVDGVQYATSYDSYDAMDRLLQATFVDGEQVSYTYSAQGMPKTVRGTISGVVTDYLADAAFNARQQPTCYRYGSPVIRQTLLFYNDSGDLRLSSLSSGAPGSTPCATPSGTALQSLSTTYDLAGNVQTIVDNNAGPQTQTFTYDALNRLTTGVASGGSSGTYNETYGYADNQGGKTGNLTSKTGVGSYTYGASSPGNCLVGTPATKPHAVATAGGTNYAYDCNGNMTTRGGYTLAYDGENRLTSVGGTAAASFVYDPDGQRVKASFGSGDSAVVSLYVGNHLEMNSVYREGMDDGQAQGWTAASGTWAVQSGAYRQSNATVTNTNTYRSQSQSQMVVVRWKATYTSGTQAGIYLYASSATGAERGNSYRIWQDATTVKIYEVNSNIAVQRASFAASNAAGQTHTYAVRYSPITGRVQVWRDGVRLGGWVDATPLTSGAYLALRTDSSDVSFDDIEVYQAKKYYYAGDRRIAMRDNGVLYYLFPDHLGGTHITASGTNGIEVGKLLYKPWGETRVSTGSTLTTWRFTGQREDATIGLYYYGARFYDPALGRFVSPDTIVPNPGDPQALNRYTYVGNRPLVLIDPSGHIQTCGDSYDQCGSTPVVPPSDDQVPLENTPFSQEINPYDPNGLVSQELYAAAETFGVPPQIVAVILQYENDPQARLGVIRRAIKQALTPLLQEINPNHDQGLGYSQGIANLKPGTATSVLRHFAIYYPESDLAQMHRLAQKGNTFDISNSTLNVRIATGYVRQSMDLFYGPDYHGPISEIGLALIINRYNTGSTSLDALEWGYGPDAAQYLREASEGRVPLYFYRSP